MSDNKKEEEVWSDGKIINREIVNEMKTAYKHAIDEKYRFFSYGDCCLLFKKPKE